ncbi:MAG: tripartite tricarboxylate transporter TctB family protein [Peptococcaceae bacterium]
MIRLNTERISSLVFIIICLSTYPSINKLDELSRTFPLAVVTGLLILSGILFVKSFVKTEKDCIFADKNQLISITSFFGGFVVYIMFIRLIGFLPSSIIYLSLCSWLLKINRQGKQAVLTAFLIGLTVCLVFFLIFRYLFLVPFPTGVIFAG